MNVAERLRALAGRGVFSNETASRLLAGDFVLTCDVADKMIENVIGVFGLPLAVAQNFQVNGRDRLVPMVVEEPSIVAGVSNAAKLARAGGGFKVIAGESLQIGQIQLVDIENPDNVIQALHARKDELLRLANVLQPRLLTRGGGTRDIEYYKYRLPDGRWTVVLHLLIDTCDAMGANLVNTVCENIAPRIESISGARAALRILSNLADRSVVTARVCIPLEQLADGAHTALQVRDGIVLATAFADTDPYRAATHNKGIMNGIDAVAIATGNDWRAIEAGAHAWAAGTGRYRSLTRWTCGGAGELLGELTIPLKVGVVGGSLKANPAVALSLGIAAADSAKSLSELMAAVGLAQNFAALRALVTHGIQRGHMRLHARSVAAAAGAAPGQFESVVHGLIESGEIKAWKADEIVARLQSGAAASGAATVTRENPGKGSASGKVILLGEHAAVYDKHVLALPIADAVVADVIEVVQRSRLTISDWNIAEEVATAPPYSGAVATFALIMQSLGIGDRFFDMQVRSRIPAAMGLGASAALAVAMIRSFNALLKLELDNREIDRLAFECEKLAHGTPSGIDNNIATYGEPVLFTRTAASRTRTVQLPANPPLVIAVSGERGITKQQVEAVRSRRDRSPELYDTIFSEIDELSIAGAAALRDSDYAALGAMMNVCHGYLNAIEVSTPTLETMIAIARANGAVGAKLTGAGGGGSIVALCPGSAVAVAAALKKAGFAIVRMDLASTLDEG